MYDLYGQDYKLYDSIISHCKKIVQLYGYQGMKTPILEHSELFNRGLGPTSSVVIGKELYTFKDEKNSIDYTLRPEGTASILRSISQNNLLLESSHNNLRFYYHGPFFRHERPQRGRNRQFHQFGVELVGQGGYNSDFEVILMAEQLLKELDIKSELHINNLGDEVDRKKYIIELKRYLSDKREKLSELSQQKLDRNPIRIFDSKDERDQSILSNGPQLNEYLSGDSKDRFELIKEKLIKFNVPFVLNPHLVRGLDYYQNTVFEFISNASVLGKSQATILAGGRYDGLLNKIMNNNSPTIIPSIGFALGVERISLLLKGKKLKEKESVLLVAIHKEAITLTNQMAIELRKIGIPTVVETNFNTNLSKLTKKYTSLNNEFNNIKYLSYFGEDEVKNQQFKLKNILSKEQSLLDFQSFIEFIKKDFTNKD
ncbi:histidyl-tRNA synthetase [Neoconidiobolus thromboides FSU 785]|nr:histidyl-tRNA synthetase [Neoconidiobolus thromboides FSU 785]